MTTKERYAGVIKWFQENKPIAETELQYHDPFQLLIAVILSAQCTDKRVNMITPALFEAFPKFNRFIVSKENEENVVNPPNNPTNKKALRLGEKSKE